MNLPSTMGPAGGVRDKIVPAKCVVACSKRVWLVKELATACCGLGQRDIHVMSGVNLDLARPRAYQREQDMSYPQR